MPTRATRRIRAGSTTLCATPPSGRGCTRSWTGGTDLRVRSGEVLAHGHDRPRRAPRAAGAPGARGGPRPRRAAPLHAGRVHDVHGERRDAATPHRRRRARTSQDPGGPDLASDRRPGLRPHGVRGDPSRRTQDHRVVLRAGRDLQLSHRRAPPRPRGGGDARHVRGGRDATTCSSEPASRSPSARTDWSTSRSTSSTRRWVRCLYALVEIANAHRIDVSARDEPLSRSEYDGTRPPTSRRWSACARPVRPVLRSGSRAS